MICVIQRITCLESTYGYTSLLDAYLNPSTLCTPCPLQLTGPSSFVPSLQTVFYINPRALAYDPMTRALYIADESHR